jgi:peptidyl-prolyl cis-trans isomerase A (cyclophilin A)
MSEHQCLIHSFIHSFHRQELTETNFWKGCRIFRVIPGFVAQFGIHGDTQVQAEWRSNAIPDDPVRVSNRRGTVVFATAGKNTRTSQIFINTRDEGNTFLDSQGFAPFGEVIEGMDIVDQFYSGYGEGAPNGNGPNQNLLQQKGDAYMKEFPRLSYIRDATFIS